MVMRRPRRRDADGLSDVDWCILNDFPRPANVDPAEWFTARDDWYPHGMRLMDGKPPLRDVWGEHRDVILERWIRERPGTRPTCWWRFDAPEEVSLSWYGTEGPPFPAREQAEYLR